MISCNHTNKSETNNIAEPSHKVENNIAIKDSLESRVSLVIIPEKLDDSELEESAKVLMTNNTNEKITTGEHYFIEHFNGDEWIKLPFFNEIAFHDVGYQLSPSESKEFYVNLYSNKYTYETGQYRVVKYYLKRDYQQTKTENYIYAPFTIESKNI